MIKFCLKCGAKTEDDGDLHCRKILVEKVKNILSTGDLEGAKSLVENERFNEDWGKWKWGMFERFSLDLRRKMAQLNAEQENQQKQQVEMQMNAQLLPFLQRAGQFIECGQFREAEIFILNNQMSYPTLPILRKYKTDLRHLIPESHRIPICYTPRADWRPFENIRTQENLYQFVHITDQQNIELIKRYDGIFSKQAMREYGIRPNKYASTELSLELDRHKNLWDYIHLSIQKSPMMYVSGINPVTLLVDSRFVFAQETMFSDRNSADNSATIGDTFEDFARINLRVAKGRWNNEDEKKLFQAEILVKHHIPIEFITFSTN